MGDWPVYPPRNGVIPGRERVLQLVSERYFNHSSREEPRIQKKTVKPGSYSILWVSWGARMRSVSLW